MMEKGSQKEENDQLNEFILELYEEALSDSVVTREELILIQEIVLRIHEYSTTVSNSFADSETITREAAKLRNLQAGIMRSVSAKALDDGIISPDEWKLIKKLVDYFGRQSIGEKSFPLEKGKMDDLPTIKYLKDKKIAFEIKTFPESTEKATESISRALGIQLNMVVKTLIFKGKSGTFYNCLIGGDGKIHYKKLKKLTEEKNIRMATPNEILAITGYKVGAIPPFALKNGIKTFIEITLNNEDILLVGAGKFGFEIVLTPEDLKKATDGEFVDIVKSTKSTNGN
ncbi:MAG: aminoacyl-tRNA deacylase [Candidatus Hodarchaeales archaeon]|jgi:Cys-tRNA(Pro)/Cys-tRNA(Cys) deacylase